MTRIEIAGRINEQGSLEVELPPGLPPSDAIVTIDLIPAPLQPDELSHLMTTEPLTGAEMIEAGLIGGWYEEKIQDGQTWVDFQRQKRREQRTTAC
jgi:hypothetical protein